MSKFDMVPADIVVDDVRTRTVKVYAVKGFYLEVLGWILTAVKSLAAYVGNAIQDFSLIHDYQFVTFRMAAKDVFIEAKEVMRSLIQAHAEFLSRRSYVFIQNVKLHLEPGVEDDLRTLRVMLMELLSIQRFPVLLRENARKWMLTINNSVIF